MSAPNLVVEQYVFHFEYLGNPVHARIIKSALNGKDFWDWEVNQPDNQHPFKGFSDLDGARQSLFSYMDGFDPTQARHAPY